MLPFLTAALPFVPAIMSGLGSVLSMRGSDKAARAAEEQAAAARAEAARRDQEAHGYLSQIPGVARQYLDPYVSRGASAQDAAMQQYNRMSANPMDYINQIVAGYSPSEGYKFKQKMLMDAARNTASEGGLLGTKYDQMQRADLINGLLSGDMQQWLSNVVGAQGAGLAGQQHVADQGYNASTDLANIIATSLSERGSLGRAQAQDMRSDARQYGLNAAQANQDSQQSVGGLLGAIGSLGKIAPADWGKLADAVGLGGSSKIAPTTVARNRLPGNMGNLGQVLPQTTGILNKFPGPVRMYGGSR